MDYNYHYDYYDHHDNKREADSKTDMTLTRKTCALLLVFLITRLAFDYQSVGWSGPKHIPTCYSCRTFLYRQKFCMVLTELLLAACTNPDGKFSIDAFVDSRFLAVGYRAHGMIIRQIEQAIGITYEILASKLGQGGMFLD